MVKPKAQSKKQQKRGIDFKKIKRKVGRKLPPPKNATNTEIKSKAIILPEQSVASEKAGLAVSKKGLTLKELLQQTSHHNGKVRKDALIGIRDIFLKYPAELKLHKLAVIEKLRERISDDDKLVRETLYQLLKSVVFPGSKEDSQELVVSLMMAYIFSAMTHLAIDVRLMAFKFLDLVLLYFPSSFSLYAEKILQSYEDLLRKNQFSLQDRSKLKSALAGLIRCLSLLPCNKREDDSTFKNDDHAQGILHAFEPDDPEDLIGLAGIIRKLLDLLPVLVSCFQDLMPLAHSTPALDAQSFDCILFTLQSVDIVVKFFVHGIGKSKKKLQSPLPPHEGRNVTTEDEMISPLILKKLWDAFPLNPIHNLSGKDDDRYFMLNAIITEIFLQMSDWNYFPPALLERILEFIEISLTEKICNGRQSSKLFHEKHVLPLIFFTPRLIMQVPSHWKLRILQAFTNVFRKCNPESSMKLACLSAIEEMLDPEDCWFSQNANDPEILDYLINWMRELPSLLVLLGHTHPLSSKALLHLQLRLGQCAQLNSPLSWEYENMQHILKDFYSTNVDETSISYGPFIRLPRDIQELSVCCLYYFSLLDPLLLQSLVSCCLCRDLDPFVVFRILEVLHSSYIAGHIQIADYFSFLVSVLSRFRVYPEEIFSATRDGAKSNRRTFKSITSLVCSHLSQIGDNNLIFQMLEKVLLDQIMLRSSVDNICAFLRVLVTLDSKPSRLSEESIINLSNVLAEYLIGVSFGEPENDDATNDMKRSHYFYLPTFVLFHRNAKLLKLVLNTMGSFVNEYGSSGSSQHRIYSMDVSSRLSAIVSVLLHMNKDRKIQQVLVSCRTEMENLLQKTLTLKSSEEINKKIEERHKMQIVYDRMKAVINSSFSGTPVI